MDNGQEMVTSSPPITKFKRRHPPAWVPCAGTKRKAYIANLGDNFDTDCRPSPAKQFAVDEEVATDILRDGFYYDPSLPPVIPNNENQGPDEVEMEEEQAIVDAEGEFVKGPGDTTNCACASSSSSRESMSKTAIVDEKECRDDSVITPHSMHESQPNSPSKLVSSKAQSLVMNGLSLVLSNEIQETLIRRRLNEDFILPKSIMDQVSGSNTSMALVPWKPPLKMENLIVKQPESSSTEKIASSMITCYQQSPEPDIFPLPYMIPFSNVQQSPLSSPESLPIEANDGNGESMDIDF